MKNYEFGKTSGLDNPVFRNDSLAELKERSHQQQSSGDLRSRSKQEEDDAWNAALPDMDTGPSWDEMSTKDKVVRVFLNTAKVMGVFCLLYFFICSLDLLSSAFKLISGKSTSTMLNSDYIGNPVVGLMVGILLTVLVQSSSTSTSIIVSMVSAGLLGVHEAVPIIMGSNVGTSVTNTIVSLTQVGDRDVFRRAFAGATVHDMFNWLSVLVLLPIEIIFGVLEKLTGSILESVSQGSGGEVKVLKVITEPFTDLIIQIDSSVLNCWGLGEWLYKTSMIEEFCAYETITDGPTEATAIVTAVTTEISELSTAVTDLVTEPFDQCPDANSTNEVGIPHSCNFLFYETGMSDSQVGIILLVISLLTLCTALIIIVKLLNSMLKGSIAVVIKKTLNADIPYVPWVTGYIALVIGAVMTFIVQSSSIFTSTLTPLIGLGMITVERAYPLTLGSNIGTTTTALLASLAGTGEGLSNAVQIALVHLFFNIFGILLFYPLPFMRFPIPMCKFLGNITARYRWFAILYLVCMFFLFPMFIFVLSLGGAAVMWGILGPIIAILVFVGIINLLQNKVPHVLPKVLQTWDFLPLPMRSLEPYDKVMTSLPCCKSCRDEPIDESLSEVVQEPIQEKKGHANPAVIVTE